MGKIINCLLIACSILLLNSCEDIETHKPFGDDTGNAPGIVKIDSYEKVPGGVKIKFIAPTDEDLMYIKIKYTLDNGKNMEARASLYSDELVIKGFGNTNPKKLVVSAVNRMENEGESITTEVIPGTPPCVIAYEQLSTYATFGGISINTSNENNDYIIIDVSTKDKKGNWYLAHTEYTSVKKINFALRGFDSTSRDFKICVRDMWENKSDEYTTTLIPLYEERLDLTKFKGFILPGDLLMGNDYPLGNLFNGNNNWNQMNLAHSPDFNPDVFPVWFTFDMGQIARLSRYIYWQRLMNNGDFLYEAGSIKNWEVWGRADLPDPSGSWDGWTKLMDCESIKPSGWPVGSKSDEDVEYARKGEEFEFPMDTPPVRYIRFKINTTHTGAGLVVMQQLWFYGTPMEQTTN